MKIFLSWSGNMSLRVAGVFRDWLPSVIQSIEPYVSSEDIDKGARWSTDIAKELENSTFGILCVTKENFEAPWLSFEAGALSKTMDKTFVNPFLFDIKRSEVQGPILQFQSTIFEKEDIKRMIKTINKACGETGISEARLETSFDVWYPHLESQLNNIKREMKATGDADDGQEETYTSEILEEILELSRDNQKLLRNPEHELSKELVELKEKIEQINLRLSLHLERRKHTKRIDSIVFDEFMHSTRNYSSSGFLMVLSLFKDDFPWIYDMGKELLDILKSKRIKREEKMDALHDFQKMIDFSFGHPAMRDLFGNRKDSIQMKELSFDLMRYLDILYNEVFV